MMLFVGLGNPGARYARNRHNIGFMALEAIHARGGFSPWRARFQGRASEGLIDGVRTLLLLPETYMNESGRAVGEAMRFLKIPLSDVVVFHDELDLPPARIRAKKGGGNAGHNGLRSITALCGNDYRRVRLGIGHPGDKDRVHSYVLNDFARSEEAWVGDLLRIVADGAPLLAAGEDARFQSEATRLLAERGWADVKTVAEDAAARKA